MNVRTIFLSLASLCAVGLIASPASATVAAPCQAFLTTVVDPITNRATVEYIMRCGSITDTIDDPVPITSQVLYGSAPPDSQFFEFSATTSTLGINFTGQATHPGSLSLYNALDDSLIDSIDFTDAATGTLTLSSLVPGDNYILDVDWFTEEDPNYFVSFNAVVNSPTASAPTSVPEPVSASLLGAGLFAMGWASRRRRATVASR